MNEEEWRDRFSRPAADHLRSLHVREVYLQILMGVRYEAPDGGPSVREMRMNGWSGSDIHLRLQSLGYEDVEIDWLLHAFQG